MERVRQYQINRLKYYYAIVEFDSVASANRFGGKFLGLVGYLMTLLQLETNLLQIEKVFILVKCLLWQLYIRNMKW